MTKIDFIYFDAGGGHRAAATALKAAIEEQNRDWEIHLVNLQEILDVLDVFRKVTGIRLEDIYNKMLAKGWTLGSAQGLMFMHGVIRLYHRPVVKLLRGFWANDKPDMVVSLVPNFNRAMCESLSGVLPTTPFVTILTDFADYPPHFWIERQPQYLVCGTPKAKSQALSAGHSPQRVFQTSGMVLRPKFYAPVTADRTTELKRLGLDPSKPTGLVLFGGQGSRAMLDIARRAPEAQFIFICGRNTDLADKLRAFPAKAARHVEGFTSEIPYFMHLSDFMVGKPGPGTISEAMAMKLPVIVEKNAWTLPQERYNADWVQENQVGVVLPNFRGIREAIAAIESKLPEFRARVAAIHNRAVFEIPEILDKILESSGLAK